MALRRPQLELGVACRPHLEQGIVAPIVKIEARDGLRMTAIEVFGEPQHGRQLPNDLSPFARQIVVAEMPPFRFRAPMVARDECDGFDFVGLEAAEIAIFDEVVRVLVVAFVADMNAGIVQDRAVFQPLPCLIGHGVNAARAIEQREGELGDVVGVIGPVTAAFGQLDDAAPPDVRIAIGLRDLLAMFRDVVEHQTFAKRQIAQADFARIESPQNRVEQNRAGDSQIRAARIEPRHLQPLFQWQRRQLLAHSPDLLGRHATVAETADRRSFALSGGDGSETEDRAGSADDPIVASTDDLFEVRVELGLDVADELAFIARRDRVAFHKPLSEPDHSHLEAAAKVDRRPDAARDFRAAAADVDHHCDLA
jgi:hypothetical protein